MSKMRHEEEDEEIKELEKKGRDRPADREHRELKICSRMACYFNPAPFIK